MPIDLDYQMGEIPNPIEQDKCFICPKCKMYMLTINCPCGYSRLTPEEIEIQLSDGLGD